MCWGEKTAAAQPFPPTFHNHHSPLPHPYNDPPPQQMPIFCLRRLSQSAGLALGLEEAQDVVLADGSLDVTDDRSGRVVEEHNADLGHSSTGS